MKIFKFVKNRKDRQKLVQEAKDWGYFRGSIKSRTDLWAGNNILDIGMGGGPHSISFIEGGANSYVGVDPLVGTDHVRDFQKHDDPNMPNYRPFPFSTDRIMELEPKIKLYSGYLEDVADEVMGCDVNIAIMAAVTEHLQNLPAVFKSIWEILGKGGLLWYSHCNYYSWTGHHRMPRSVASWNHNDPEQAKVVDWRHLNFDHPDFSNPNFNRVRLADIRALTNKYFEIIEWSVSVEGFERLTPDLRKKFKNYTLEELLGQNIYVTGRRRDQPLDIDLSNREFFHPSNSYRITDDYSAENMEEYRLKNYVYLSKNNQINSHSTNNKAASRLFDTLKPGDRVRIQKFVHKLDLTVSEVIQPEAALTRIRVMEDIPEQLLSENYQQWEMLKI